MLDCLKFELHEVVCLSGLLASSRVGTSCKTLGDVCRSCFRSVQLWSFVYAHTLGMILVCNHLQQNRSCGLLVFSQSCGERAIIHIERRQSGLLGETIDVLDRTMPQERSVKTSGSSKARRNELLQCVVAAFSNRSSRLRGEVLTMTGFGAMTGSSFSSISSSSDME